MPSTFCFSPSPPLLAPPKSIFSQAPPPQKSTKMSLRKKIIATSWHYSDMTTRFGGPYRHRSGIINRHINTFLGVLSAHPKRPET